MAEETRHLVPEPQPSTSRGGYNSIETELPSVEIGNMLFFDGIQYGAFPIKKNPT